MGDDSNSSLREYPAISSTIRSRNSYTYASPMHAPLAGETAMTKKQLKMQRLALTLMREFGLEEGLWEFRWNLRTRMAGACCYPFEGLPGRIELSCHFVQMNSPEAIENMIRHEIAHALTAEHAASHGPEWVKACKITGARPEATCTGTMPKGKWQATCGRCKSVFDRHRKPRCEESWCTACGLPDGLLNWQLA